MEKGKVKKGGKGVKLWERSKSKGFNNLLGFRDRWEPGLDYSLRNRVVMVCFLEKGGGR